MKYTLYHQDFGYFETDLWVMADRKIAQGWQFKSPEKEEEKEHVEEVKASAPEVCEPVKEIVKEPVKEPVTEETKKQRGRPKKA